MADIEYVDNIEDLGPEIRLQLVMGVIGIPLLIASVILNALAFSIAGFSAYRAMYYWLVSLAAVARDIGGPLLVVGEIGILQRNGSRRGWIFLALYVISWIWSYLFSFVIIPDIAPTANWLVGILAEAYYYSTFFFSLYAWWSIHSVVSNRLSYFSYLILNGFEPILAYGLSYLLFGSGPHSVYTPFELLQFLIPDLFCSILVYLVLSLFFIGQLRACRREEYVGVASSSTIE